MKNCRVVIHVIIAVLSFQSFGKFFMPVPIPAERLIKNTNAYIAENPADPKGYYNLGRIHYMAFINKSHKVNAFATKDKLLEVAPDHMSSGLKRRQIWEYASELALKEMGCSSIPKYKTKDRDIYNKLVKEKYRQLEKENWRPPNEPSNNELFEHAELAAQNFEKAISMDNDNGLYYLSYASLLTQYIDFIRDIKSEHLPSQFQGIMLERSKELFYKAYKLSILNDMKHKSMPLEGLNSLVAYESGKAYINLVRSLNDISKEDKKIVKAISKNINKLEKLEIRAITPIIFSLNQKGCLSDLLEINKKIMFDLDGNGIIEEWPWVKPDTGILVWDPQGAGDVTSGRQFFGSVTWWMFYEDGYHAMDALDDNRDGQLTGNELAGISVWFDKNTNGISETGEVVPISQLNITSLSTRSDETEDRCPKCTKGLKLKGGEIMPTYDWIATRP